MGRDSVLDGLYHERLPRSAQPLRIRLHGSFRICDATGLDLTPRGSKARAIVAMLLFAPNGVRSRLWLREHLWSDRGNPEGMMSLRQSLSEIRRAFGSLASLLETDRTTVRLAPEMTALLQGEGEFLEDLVIHDPQFVLWRDEVRGGARVRSPETRERATDDPNHRPGSVATVLRTEPAARYPGILVEIAGDAVSVDGELLASADELRTLLACETRLRVLSQRAEPHSADYRFRVTNHAYAPGSISVSLETAGNEVLGVRHRDDMSADDFPRAAIANLTTLLRAEECRRALATPEDDDLRNLLWRASHHMHNMNPRDAATASALVDRAAELAPDDGQVSTARAHVAMIEAWAVRGERNVTNRAIRLGRDATARSPHDPGAFYVLGISLSLQRFRLEARATIEEALRLRPAHAMSQLQKGSNLIHDGRYADALQALAVAETMGETDRRRYIIFGEIAMAHLLAGGYEDAVQAAIRSIAVRPRYWYAHAVRAVALLRAGDDRASRAVADLRAMRPDLSRAHLTWLPNDDPGVAEALADDLALR